MGSISVIGGEAKTITVTAQLTDKAAFVDLTKEAKLAVLFKAGESIRWTETNGNYASDHEQAIDFTLTDKTFSATITGPFKAGTYHLMLSSKSGTGVLNDVRVSSDDTAPPIEPTDPDDDMNSTAGCGCTSGSSQSSSWFLLLLALGGAFMGRRRTRN